MSGKGAVGIEIELSEDMDVEENMPMRTRDELHGGSTKPIRLHYRLKMVNELFNMWMLRAYISGCAITSNSPSVTPRSICSATT